MRSVIKTIEQNNIFVASTLALIATIFFVINDATIKYLSLQNVKFYHFIFYGTPAYLVIPIYLLVSGKFKTKMKATNYFIPLLRGSVFVPMPFITFLALQNISLPEFTTLTMVAPLFSLMFSIFILREKLNLFLLLSIFCGIIGVLFVVKPGFESFNSYFIFVLFNAFLISLTTLIVNKYSEVTSSEGFFVYGGIFVHGLGVIMFIFDPKLFNIQTLILIVFASIFVNAAIFSVVVAFQKAQRFYGAISCLNYLQILWSVIIGFLLFDQGFGLVSLVGASLIVLSGVLSLSAQSRQLVE